MNAHGAALILVPKRFRFLKRLLCVENGAVLVPYVLGLVLLSASVLKGLQLATLPTAERDLFTSRPFLIGLVEFEFALGLWLLAGFLGKLARVASIGCFGAFLGVALYEAGSGATSCGCFGEVQLHPWYGAVIDLAAIGGLIFWRPGKDAVVMQRARAVHAAICVSVLLLTGVGGGLAMASYRPVTLNSEGEFLGDGNVVLLEPEKWIGKSLPLLRYIDLKDELAHGNWVLILYRHNCPKCAKEIARYEATSLAAVYSPTTARVALIEVPPYAGPRIASTTHGSHSRSGRLSDVKAWFVSTPTILVLSEGIVHLPLDNDQAALAEGRP